MRCVVVSRMEVCIFEEMSHMLCCTSNTHGVVHLMGGLPSQVSYHMKGITFHTTPNPSPVLPSPGIASGVVASTCKPPTARITYGMEQQQAICCSSKPYGMAHLQGGKVKEESLSSSCRVSLLPVVMVSWCHVVAVCVMLLRCAHVACCCGVRIK